MRDELRRDPLGAGSETTAAPGAVLFITPEQATFSAERLLLTGRGLGLGEPVAGTFRAQVLSFRRLAMLIAREVGIFGGKPGAGRAVPKPMDDVARVVLLEETVRRHKGELTVFGAVADRPGFIRKLDNTLRELRQHGHSGASLREVLSGGGPGGVDAVTQRKLTDLAVLLDAWSVEVEKSDAWDFEFLMHQAALKAPLAPLVVGTNQLPQRGPARVWVDGFSAFSTLEIRMLVALAKHAQDLAITLMADPDSPAIRDLRAAVTLGGGRHHHGEWVLQDGPFARTERLHRRLIDAFRQHSVTIESTLPLRERRRFADPALLQVEAELFTDGEAPPPPGTVAERPNRAMPVRNDKGKKKDVRRVAAQSTLFDLLEAAPGPAAPPVAAAPGAHEAQSLTARFKTGVEIWESSDPETEVRVTAQAIRDLVIGRRADGTTTGLRYRQIGVIVPDLEGYGDALRRVFSEHGIPHFIDQRRGIAHHPLVELLRSAVAIAANRWDRDDVLLYLKTRLAGVGEEDVALVENYLIEHGITHVPWSLPWKWIAPNRTEDEVGASALPASAWERLARINAVRAKVWADLEPWVAVVEEAARKTPDETSQLPAGEPAAGAAGPEGAVFVRGLRDLMTRLNIEAQLQAWIDGARTPNPEAPAGNAELAQVHEQVWREVVQLMGLLETILAGKPRTLSEVERLLNTALESLTLGLIPPTVDQVLVSSVTRSRVPELEVVFILGALEGQFPKVVEEDPILSDAQRETFNARAADPIGEGSDRQLLEMPFFDYTAFTRAGKLLVVSYPLATRTGKAVGKSRYIPRLRELLGEGLRERTFDAGARTDVDRIGTIDDLLTAVAAWARDEVGRRGAITSSEAEQQKAGALEALYNWLAASNDPAFRRPLSLVWQCVAGRPEPRLDPRLAERFYPPSQGLYLSISQLEKFAACPLQYFMHYTLGLKPREAFALDQLNMGVLYHRILERIYRKIINGALDWPQCEAHSLRAALEGEVDGAIAELHAEIADREPGYEKMRARIKRNLGMILEADRRRACPGTLRPKAVEVFFGGSKEKDTRGGTLVKLPILEVKTPLQSRVFVNGKIDRVDGDRRAGDGEGTVAGPMAVIDYKSSAKRTLELYRVLAGLALQLPVYAMVMRDLGGGSPIAALYMALGITRKRIAHAGEVVDTDEDAFYQLFQPRGIIDRAGMPRLDPEVEEQRGSAWYKAKITAKGEIGKSSDLVTHEDFETVLDFARWKIAALADELMQGKIAPSPYRQKAESSCTMCEFGSLCPFDRTGGEYREVPKLGNAEALGRMRAEMGGGLEGR
jgi:ATP-dependent helicase/nuclease subunit B